MQFVTISKPQPLSLEPLAAPWRITFDTNPDTCNLSCIMCEEHSEFSNRKQACLASGQTPRVMDFDIIQQVVAECAPMGLEEIIPSTMGEPLLYPHFQAIIDLCHQHDLKLNLTTNGSFPGLGARAWANRIIPVGSDVKISWNGYSREVQERIMKGSNHQRHLANLKAFLEVRDQIAAEGGNYCSVTLQVTFMEANLNEFPALIQMAKELGIDRVKGHHLWVHNERMAGQNLRRNRESIRRWNAIVKECHEVAGNSIQLVNFNELDPHHKQELHPAAVCPFLGREAWVNWEGRFDPCCAPDELRKTLGNFGSVRDQGMMELWQSDSYGHCRDNYLENDLCKSCNMRVLPEVQE